MKKLTFLILLLLATISTYQTFAAIPNSGPSGENPQGLFATYFSNLALSPCNSTSLLTGFNSTAGSDFLKGTCTSLGTLIGAFFSTFPAPTSDEVLAGFNPTTGAPIYKIATSVWRNVTGGITYTGGNVGIGVEVPASPLHVSGSVLATRFADTTNGTWFPWTNNYNYIRGTTYLSGFLVDEQDARFYINPASVSVLSGVSISGSIVGRTPTLPNELATKSYVDMNANNASGANIYLNFGPGQNPQCPSGWTHVGTGPTYGDGFNSRVCAIKNPSNLIYREFGPGQSPQCPTTWTLVGSGPTYGAGYNTVVCSISATAPITAVVPPVNGVCSTTTPNTCTTGTAAGYNPGSCGGSATWSCNGSNGGTNASCTKTNPVCATNASCGGSANTCSAGTPSGYSAGACGGSQSWMCNSTNGGSSASCSLTNPACPTSLSCQTRGGKTVAGGSTTIVYWDQVQSVLCEGETVTCDGADGRLKKSSPYAAQSSFGSAVDVLFPGGWLTMNNDTCRLNQCQISGVTTYQYFDTNNGLSYYCAGGTSFSSVGGYSASVLSTSCAIPSNTSIKIPNGLCGKLAGSAYYCDNGTWRNDASSLKYCK